MKFPKKIPTPEEENTCGLFMCVSCAFFENLPMIERKQEKGASPRAKLELEDIKVIFNAKTFSRFAGLHFAAIQSIYPSFSTSIGLLHICDSADPADIATLFICEYAQRANGNGDLDAQIAEHIRTLFAQCD